MEALYNNKYHHKDISLLYKNRDILEEAANPQNSLYDRIQFLAIFSSNLDDFLKVNLSNICQLKKIKKPLRKNFIKKPKKILRAFLLEIDEQRKECYYIFKEEILPALKKNNIHLINHTQFSTTQKIVAKAYFNDVLLSQLNTQVQHTTSQNQLTINYESIYLSTLKGESDLHIIEVPKNIHRFFIFPRINGKYYITFIDDILKYNLKQSIREELNLDFYSFILSKDRQSYLKSELPIKDIELKISTRLLIDRKAPLELQKAIYDAIDREKLKVTKSTTYQNLKDFKTFPDLISVMLKDIA